MSAPLIRCIIVQTVGRLISRSRAACIALNPFFAFNFLTRDPASILRRRLDLSIYQGADVNDQEPILQFFAFEHLPEHLRAVSKPFGDLAAAIVETLPRNPERTVALRKLLEAKDAAVRARLFK